MLTPTRRQLSLAHLPPWVCWEYMRREIERRAAISRVPALISPSWRRWRAAPIHAWLARLGRIEPPPVKTTKREREVIRLLSMTTDKEVAAALAPEFLRWLWVAK